MMVRKYVLIFENSHWGSGHCAKLLFLFDWYPGPEHGLPGYPRICRGGESKYAIVFQIHATE